MLRHGLLFLSQSETAKKVLTGTPVTRGMSRRFVPGETVEELIVATRAANAEGIKVTANYLGEHVESEAAARAAADTYLEVLDRIHQEGLDANVSLKFTQMGQEISRAFLEENLGRLLERSRDYGIFVRFDMEDSQHTQATLDEFERFWGRGWRDIGVVLQSYLFRTPEDAARMVELGARVRLCKGAYDEPAEVAYQSRREVDQNFVRVMKSLLKRGHYPAIATHDVAMIKATIAYADARGIGKDRFEFQMLYGVRRDLQRALVKQGYNVRVYIPFGSAWYSYLMRRLAERPANVGFMVSSVLKESPLGFLVPDGAPDGSR
jgi:proline dehydrogenase